MYRAQCNDIISNIVFIQMFFTLFSNKNNYNKIRLTENWNTYFSNNNIIFKIILNTLTFIQILFLFLFNLVCNLVIEKWNLFFFQIMILEHLHFCLANHACVSHLLRGQPHLLECYYRNCLIGTHMCVHPVSEWSVFLPFSVNCSQVAMFQIMPALCLHGQGEWGGWSTKFGQAWTGGGGLKNYQIFTDILYGWPLT